LSHFLQECIEDYALHRDVHAKCLKLRVEKQSMFRTQLFLSWHTSRRSHSRICKRRYVCRICLRCRLHADDGFAVARAPAGLK